MSVQTTTETEAGRPADLWGDGCSALANLDMAWRELNQNIDTVLLGMNLEALPMTSCVEFQKRFASVSLCWARGHFSKHPPLFRPTDNSTYSPKPAFIWQRISNVPLQQ